MKANKINTKCEHIDTQIVRSGRSTAFIKDHYSAYVKIPKKHPWRKFKKNGQLDKEKIYDEAMKNPLYIKLIGGSAVLTLSDKKWIGFSTEEWGDQKLNWTPKQINKMLKIWQKIIKDADRKN